jgi:hypothetical protein
MKKSMKGFAVVIAVGMVLCLSGVAFAQGGPSLIVVANDESYKLAENWIEFLRNESVPYRQTKPAEFDKYKKEKFIAILGGPNESGGVGEIVKQVLTKEEQEFVSKPGSSRMYLKENIFAQGQKILVFAGADRELAGKARVSNRSKWIDYLNAWFNIDISSAGLAAY